MADELKRDFGPQLAAVELKPGSGGVFDVTANGQLVFSKYETGRFPDPSEVQRTIRQVPIK